MATPLHGIPFQKGLQIVFLSRGCPAVDEEFCLVVLPEKSASLKIERRALKTTKIPTNAISLAFSELVPVSVGIPLDFVLRNLLTFFWIVVLYGTPFVTASIHAISSL
jgi:hypothetical protein